MVAGKLRDLVHGIVQVDGIAGVAPTLHRYVVDAAHPDRDGEEVAALEAAVHGVVGAEGRADRAELAGVRVRLDERHEPRQHPPLVLTVPPRSLFALQIVARPAFASERRDAGALHL